MWLGHFSPFASMYDFNRAHIFCHVRILQLRLTCVNLAMSHDQGVAVCPTARSALAVHENVRR